MNLYTTLKDLCLCPSVSGRENNIREKLTSLISPFADDVTTDALGNLIAKKYGKNDLDDLISIGSIGLIKGVESYSKSKGTTLATYLARCIENEILMHLRANKKYQNTGCLQNKMGVDGDGNEYTLMDVLAVKEDSVFHQAEVSILRDNLLKAIRQHLTEQEQKIILLRYGIEEGSTPLTQLQTAKIMGISRSYISRIETRALEKLRKQMEQ